MYNGFTTVKESHLQSAKIPKMSSPGPGIIEAKSHDPAGIKFSGRHNAENWLTRSHVSLCRFSLVMESIVFSDSQNTEKVLPGNKLPLN
jgi:hypothetical protein